MSTVGRRAQKPDGSAGSVPFVSPDGKYLFIGRDQRSYWAEAGIISELRARYAGRSTSPSGE